MSALGYIYVFAGGGYFKIGATRYHPTAAVGGRFRGIACACPFELTVFAARQVVNPFACERVLHKRYAKFRVRGEWFKLDQEHSEMLRRDIELLVERDTKLPMGANVIARHYRDGTGPFSPEELGIVPKTVPVAA